MATGRPGGSSLSGQSLPNSKPGSLHQPCYALAPAKLPPGNLCPPSHPSLCGVPFVRVWLHSLRPLYTPRSRPLYTPRLGFTYARSQGLYTPRLGLYSTHPRPIHTQPRPYTCFHPTWHIPTLRPLHTPTPGLCYTSSSGPYTPPASGLYTHPPQGPWLIPAQSLLHTCLALPGAPTATLLH